MTDLKDYEIAAFVAWVTRQWTAEDRRRFASEFPTIYNKICGENIVRVQFPQDREPTEIPEVAWFDRDTATAPPYGEILCGCGQVGGPHVHSAGRIYAPGVFLRKKR